MNPTFIETVNSVWWKQVNGEVTLVYSTPRVIRIERIRVEGANLKHVRRNGIRELFGKSGCEFDALLFPPDTLDITVEDAVNAIVYVLYRNADD